MSKANAIIPGISKKDWKNQHCVKPSDPIIAVALSLGKMSGMQAKDYEDWTSIVHTRRWSRNIDGIQSLLASGQEMDIYWAENGRLQTSWRVVPKAKVDGYFQSTLFESVGIKELRRILRPIKEARILDACLPARFGLPNENSGGRRLRL